MTEKRFTLAYEKGNWWAVRDGDITLWKEEVIGLLNDLNNDNCQLKRKALDMEMDRDYYSTKSASLEEGYLQLQRENEKLKSELKSLRKKYNDFSDAVDKRLKELME